ncbi:hypothetical protein GCM10028803_50130 [Larkinella knui]|uniref:Lipoprotein n=1 Tax=Larkinella knui TaxID=2025310 RepID=A0A3P1CQP0_9BACT|nr:hypothetical protein [Larkinella knui]RRB15579.1 hypothetical protein EHT87_13755 [Larkinella knui]
MSTRFIRQGLFFFGFSALVIGCIEAPDFDNTPQISSPTVTSYPAFDDFSQIPKDSVVISVRFQDGDGNLGLSVEDRTKDSASYREWGNYELKTYRFVNGKFEFVNLAILNKLFFPRLKPDDKNSPLEGKLDFSQSFLRSRNTKMTPVKFAIRIRDRSLKVSNVVETDTISVPLN